MPLHVVKRGLDIPILGRATGEPVQIEAPARVAYTPTEFRGLVPRLAVKEGDEVKAGGALFTSKRTPAIRLLSPVAGRVAEIRRGHRRVIEAVVVERTGDAQESLRTHDLAALERIPREQAIADLQAGGLWPTLRTRPLDVVADPAVPPQAILVGGMETGPLQPGPEVLLDKDAGDQLQAGIHVLRALTDGKVYLTLAEGSSHPALANVQGVDVHTFLGPHPAGDPGVQVNLVEPPRGTSKVWYIRAWEVALIGRLFLEGRFPAERTYAVVGTGAVHQRFVRTVLGAPLRHVVGDVAPGPMRWIRGSVLTGDRADPDTGFASFYRNAVHILPDMTDRELLGWATPQLARWSFHRAYLSGFFRAKRQVDMRPGINGGHRALVVAHVYERVVPTPDINVPFLFKSIIAGDLEESMQLGLLDLTDEEAALCTYVCPSKMEFDVLLRQGLQQYVKEM